MLQDYKEDFFAWNKMDEIGVLIGNAKVLLINLFISHILEAIPTSVTVFKYSIHDFLISVQTWLERKRKENICSEREREGKEVLDCTFYESKVDIYAEKPLFFIFGHNPIENNLTKTMTISRGN